MKKFSKEIGIVSYGGYIPRYRITVEEIAETYKKDASRMKQGLGLKEKTVPGKDEDTITVAANAAMQMKNRVSDIDNIGAIYIGSESHPYAVKSSSSIVGDILNVGNDYTAADLEFACKAGTAGIQMVLGLVSSGMIKKGVAIGADTAQGAPGDALEYSAACAAASFLIGTENIIAKVLHTTSTTTDTPDFWRREHQKYPSHGGRFTGEPAYFAHVIGNTKKILSETKTQISDYDHVVFHMPNGKFPSAAGKILGVSKDQMKYGFVVPELGNSYSACSLIGLVNVLDNAKPGEKILLTSYGSGSGSDSFIIEVTDEMVKYRKSIKKLNGDKLLGQMIKNKEYLTYGQYINHAKKL